MNVSILVPKQAVLASIIDPRTMFTAVNDFLEKAGQAPLFTVELVGLSTDVHLHGGLFTVHTDRLVQQVEKTDLIIIPALSGDMQHALELNADLILWIRRQQAQGAEVVSLCVGAFLLAATGLLNGKACSTHWVAANEFRAMFPAVALVDGSIITEQNGVYSSGGATSYWNLLLYLVEKFADRTMAIRVAKYLAIDMDRSSQSAFMMFQGQKAHHDEVVKNIQNYIEANVADKLTIDDLADAFAIGRRSLERRFKKITNNTVAEYIQRVKIEAAKNQLEPGVKNVNEIMYNVGYTDTKAFRATFKKITGLSPIAYRDKYTRKEVAL